MSDSEFDILDDPYDSELEETLAKLEQSYSASQAQPQQPQRATTSTTTTSSSSSTSLFIPPVTSSHSNHHRRPFQPPSFQSKHAPPVRQPIQRHHGHRNGQRNAPIVIEEDDQDGLGQEEEPEPPEVIMAEDGGMIVVQHTKPPSPRKASNRSNTVHQPNHHQEEVIVRNLNDQDEFDDADDRWWAENRGLDKVEEEAIRLSQQATAKHPNLNGTRGGVVVEKVQGDAPRNPGIEESTVQAELQSMKTENERLKRALQAKEGEVKVVRQNFNRVNAEVGKLREQELLREREHRLALERANEENKRQLERIETQTAFRRVEQDTSRKAWPSSVRRLPPTTLRESGRRSDAQNAAGLTTPTKRRKGEPFTPTRSRQILGGGVSRSGSGSGSGTGGAIRFKKGFDREEPGSPSRSRGARGSTLEKGKPNTKPPPPPAFPRFQNSFSNLLPETKAATSTIPLTPPRKHGSTSKAGVPEKDDSVFNSNVQDQNAYGHDDDDDGDVMMQDDVRPHLSPIPDDQRKGLNESRPSSDAEAEKRHAWAIAELARRRAELVRNVLAHTCEAPKQPLSHPPTKYNLRPTHPLPPTRHHVSTLHRLLDVKLAEGTSPSLARRCECANQMLLRTLMQASSSLAEEGLESILSEQDSWEERLEDCMVDLFESLAAAFKTLMGIFLRLCMVDYLRDVFKLAYSLCISHPGFVNSLTENQDPCLAKAFDSGGSSSSDQVALLETPRNLNKIMVELVRKCNAVPILVSSPDSVPSEDELAALGLATPEPVEGVQMSTIPRTQVEPSKEKALAKVAAARMVEVEISMKTKPWDMGSESREQCLECVLDMMEILTWTHREDGLQHYLKFAVDAPGFLQTFLDSKTRAANLTRTVRLLVSLTHDRVLTNQILSARFDEGLQSNLSPRLRDSKFPLLEVLSRHLVDRRSDMAQSDSHELHRNVGILLTQIALKSPDSCKVLAESSALIAALVKCLSLDSDRIWVEDGLGLGLSDLERIVERIQMDVRLLSHLFKSSSSSSGDRTGGGIGLAEKLASQQAHNLLNGIRHTFIVSLNRIAFAPEPSWLAEDFGVELVSGLECVSDLAGDLVDLVLSPDETDTIYEMLGSGSDHEDLDGSAGQEAWDQGSETQDEELEGGKANENVIIADDDEEELAALAIKETEVICIDD
ncbi:hypothetical protein IE53DRAFT_171133 [Violaceomyces palustris]|uniref:Uncharacterized protein n=1 Tax=Violaceomyces palustris TaxID=1673888 RepID=A0ACD0P608_9BASI|nr:hypothetical protein IE53DRAFT_171133 [Violaceomyces palustris]